MEILPKNGFIRAQSSFNAQLKFIPRRSLSKDAESYFDSDTGVLEVPMTVQVAGQPTNGPFLHKDKKRRRLRCVWLQEEPKTQPGCSCEASKLLPPASGPVLLAFNHQKQSHTFIHSPFGQQTTQQLGKKYHSYMVLC
ncbi:hypothetical protein ILYODFUR_008951 [Ilyodon furcidens]|uniref:CFAP74 third Ig-like domain-containing protein n=1 Tax=Ilyodon furcidens TaxID=33524 RepID=A0ABV0VCC7_9TELE